MTKVLVIQGAGMNMRGKAQVEIFGPSSLDQINDQIRGYARDLGIDLEMFHSNIEGEVANALYDAHDGDVDAAVINPAGYTGTTGPLRTAITQVRFPVFEVHVSNPRSPGRRLDHPARVQGLGVGVRGLRLLPGAGGRQVPDRLGTR